MAWDTPDVYNNPAEFGLTSLGSVEWEEPNYSFNFSVVWKHTDGTYYWARDAGCSCPSPFEDYTDLNGLESGTMFEAAAYLQDMAVKYASDSEYGGRSKQALDADVADLIMKIVS